MRTKVAKPFHRQPSAASGGDHRSGWRQRRRAERSLACSLVSLVALAVLMIGIDFWLPVTGTDRFQTFAIVALPLAVASVAGVAAIVLSISLFLDGRLCAILWLAPLLLAAAWVALRIQWWWLLTQRQHPPVADEKALNAGPALLILLAAAWLATLISALRYAEWRNSAT